MTEAPADRWDSPRSAWSREAAATRRPSYVHLPSQGGPSTRGAQHRRAVSWRAWRFCPIIYITRFSLATCTLVALTVPCAAQSWVSTSAPGFGNPWNTLVDSQLFDGDLWVATENPLQGAEIWRTDGLSAWTASNTGGFGDFENRAIVSSTVFGNHLVVLTRNWSTGSEVWSFDGANWSQTNADGFGDANNEDGGLFALGGSLYAVSYNYATGCEVHRFNGGSSWTTIGADGLGNPDNLEANLTLFGGNLYAGTYNYFDGCEVRRFVSGTTWTRVDPGSGFDASGAENEDAGIGTYGGNLYAGTYNESTGTELWQYLGGATWIQRNVDGFGDPNNIDTGAVTEFGGALYLGTISTILAGGEVWRFDGGSTFVQVGPAGFGNAANEAVLVLAEYAGALHASTYNWNSGTEIWRYGAGTNWTRIDPGAPGPGNGGFGDPSNALAGLEALNGELHAVLPTAVWRMGTGFGSNYCMAAANSSGQPGTMSGIGSTMASAMDLTLTASDLPNNQFGIFLASRTQAFVVGAGGTSNGNLCLGGIIGRFSMPTQILSTGSSGSFSLVVDTTRVPEGGTFQTIAAGDTWNFQAWHRDQVGIGSNFTDGFEITFN